MPDEAKKPSLAGVTEQVTDIFEENQGPFEALYYSKEMMNKYEPLAEAMRKQEQDPNSPEVKSQVDEAIRDYRRMEWGSSWDGNKYDMVIYGATGVTGYLLMSYMRKHALVNNPEPFTFALAGRNLEKLKAMRERELGGTKWANTPLIVASYDDMFSIIDMVKSARVIVNIAGPYMLTEADILVDACIQLKTDYTDISGEMPHSLKLYAQHNAAKEAGVLIVPSAALEGGYGDLGAFLCAKKLKDEYGEEMRHYSVYNEWSGHTTGVGAGAATYKARAAMNETDKKMKDAMRNPFVCGGFIPDIDENGHKDISIEKGTGIATCKVRQEDLDVNFSRVTYNEKAGCWGAPWQYAYFQTRILRRSNMLMSELTGQPYGYQVNFQEFYLMPDEASARAMVRERGTTSVAQEKKKLQEEGRYYETGGEVILDDDALDAWCSVNMFAESQSGKTVKMSFRDGDGYYSSAHFAIELAFCMIFDRTELPFRGGCLTPGVAGGTHLTRRLINSGTVFCMDYWEDTSKLPRGKSVTQPQSETQKPDAGVTAA